MACVAPAVSALELAGRTAPAWPAARPPVARMCCEACRRAAVLAAWRCARAVHWMVFDSVEGSVPAATRSGADPWPWELPCLVTGDDFVEGAVACAALARWCDDVARALGEVQDGTDPETPDHTLLAALEWHMSTSAEQLDTLAHLMVQGRWDRDTAVWIADELVQRLAEACGSEWP